MDPRVQANADAGRKRMRKVRNGSSGSAGREMCVEGATPHLTTARSPMKVKRGERILIILSET